MRTAAALGVMGLGILLAAPSAGAYAIKVRVEWLDEFEILHDQVETNQTVEYYDATFNVKARYERPVQCVSDTVFTIVLQAADTSANEGESWAIVPGAVQFRIPAGTYPSGYPAGTGLVRVGNATITLIQDFEKVPLPVSDSVDIRAPPATVQLSGANACYATPPENVSPGTGTTNSARLTVDYDRPKEPDRLPAKRSPGLEAPWVVLAFAGWVGWMRRGAR